MNAVEIEEAISQLADQPFDPDSFPFAFLEAFGNKATTIKRLKSGSSNASDIEGGVLQRNNIHITVCAKGEVTKTLLKLKASRATTKAKAKFVLATDGANFEAEDLESGETVPCAYTDFPDHFSFFLRLAGITTVKQVRESSFDIRATSRLNRLYVELLKDNPEWGSGKRRPDMNHFMARLIFCFFAEDTDFATIAHRYCGLLVPWVRSTGKGQSGHLCPRHLSVDHHLDAALIERTASLVEMTSFGKGSADLPQAHVLVALVARPGRLSTLPTKSGGVQHHIGGPFCAIIMF